MTTIWKFPIAIEDTLDLKMPAGATVLSVDVQQNRPMLWAIVDSEMPLQHRTFCVRGTGQPFNGHEGRFIGTFQLIAGALPLVFHLFEYVA